jgi:hypothetical protein
VIWPEHSPEFIPLDFLWGCTKENAYAT